ncbi:hypothetical protein MMC31_003652 [Peltigera leucophlebia]|nr:hypothetical protein [Peltigera leucophlebia]
MDGLVQQPQYGQSMELVAIHSKYLTDDALLCAIGNMQKLNGKILTSEERHAFYMHAFALNLADEGLWLPNYYRDKSPYISFHEDAWPAEIGIHKAKILKWGYIEPEELIKQLSELKPSDNFTLRKHHHRQMEWDKSTTPVTPEAVWPPEADWEHISHSALGTVFPRYLVKVLYELRKHANNRGEKFYDERYEKVKTKQSEVIQRWEDEHPDSVLADDPLSIYRTWPAILMAQQKVRRGSRRYIADLLKMETKKEAVLKTDSDPYISEMPLSSPLHARLGIPWHGYEIFLDQEDVEDEMIAIIS